MSDHTLEVRKFEGNIANLQLVALEHPNSEHEQVRVMCPLAVMTREQALIHAAWLVAVVDQSADFAIFRSILKAVLES